MVKLEPTKEQYKALTTTMYCFNAACNTIAEKAFEIQSASKFKLQKEVYYPIRERYNLSAQLTIRAISKVAEAYKRDKSIKPTFRRDGGIVYDQRILSWKGLEAVSMTTLKGRLTIPICIGDYQRVRMDRIRGQADLILRQGIFYLCVVVETPEECPYDSNEVLGVDLGIKNLAVDSDGIVYSGEHINKRRQQLDTLKARLQGKGTKSAKRHLKKLSGKMARFTRDTNHCISKIVVAKAKGTLRVVALEDLKIKRATKKSNKSVSNAQRRNLSTWSFGMLRDFIKYKAAIVGVPLKFVNPKDTSIECPACGTVNRDNRQTRDVFKCVTCGFVGHADHTAAINIAHRALISEPIVALSNRVTSSLL